MAEKRGDDATTTTQLPGTTLCTGLNETFRTIISANLQRPESLSLQKLEFWYQGHMAANGNELTLKSTVICKTLDDELEESAIDCCIAELEENF